MTTPCAFCGEPVKDAPECPFPGGRPTHRECGIRLVVGSVAHQMKRCSCFVPGSEEDDPPHLSLRQGAAAAVNLYNLLQARN